MNLFDYVRPASVAEAVAAASEPGAAYLAAGTNLLDLMKGGVARPEPAGRRHPAARARPDRDAAGRRRADRRHGAQRRSRPRRGLRRRLSRGGGGAALGRLAAAAQRRHGRRQPDAAHALRLFLRRRQRLQPARAGSRLRRAARARTAPMRCSAGAAPASPRTRPISAFRWSPSTPWSRSRARTGAARCRWRTSTCFPARRRSAKPCWRRAT